MDFQVRRDDLRVTRDAPLTPPGELAPGEVRVRLVRFSYTANNLTYGAMGEALRYWSFFPAADGWGRIPVWGDAEVVASAADGVIAGDRFFGYYAPCSESVLTVRTTRRGVVEISPHRTELPPVYNQYVRVDDDDELRVVFQPLFGTAFFIDDQLAEEASADRVLLGSASSKTAYATAHLLSERADGPEVVGLTSAGNAGFVRSLGFYDAVVEYGQELPGGDAVFVDMSGSARLRRDVHEAYGERLQASIAVGFTHWQDRPAGGEDLPGPAPRFFFAPERVVKRSGDWGGAELGRRVDEAMQRFLAAIEGKVAIEHGTGYEDLRRVHLAFADGTADPRAAHVLTAA